MKVLKYFIYCIILANVFFSSCLKDKGNYTYSVLPDFYVDTIGAVKSFSVYQSLGKVTFTPKLVYTGSDSSMLTYQWRLYAADGVFDTLSRKKSINSIIARAPGNYTLEFKAKLPSGIIAQMQYSLQVMSPIPSGYMVAYDAPNGGTDVDVIRAPDFITGAKDTVMRNVYSSRNGTTLTGSPVAVSYFDATSCHLYTTKTGLKVSSTDFVYLQNFQQMFAMLNPPDTIAPQFYGPGSLNTGVFVNNGSVYWSYGGSYIGRVIADAKGYLAAPFVYTHYGKGGGFYDQKNMRFLTIEQQTSQASLFPNSNSTARFNLNNIGKQLMFIDRGFGVNGSDNYKWGFFKDVTGNGRYLYVIDVLSPLTPDIGVVDISIAPNILNANFFATDILGPAFFYATTSTVYYSQYGSNAITTPVAGFTAPLGEAITSMRLFKSENYYGTGVLTENDCKFIFIATWNSTTKIGKVYLYSTNVTSGIMGATPVKTWTVGGKVGCMGWKKT
jgi:hypothetical protein